MSKADKTQTAASVYALRTAFSTFDPFVMLTERECSAIIGLSVAWLKAARIEAAATFEPSRGPKPTIIGGAVRYAVGDVRQWLEDHRARGGSTTGRDGRRANQPGRRPSKLREALPRPAASL